jgi:hypothetical protein
MPLTTHNGDYEEQSNKKRFKTGRSTIRAQQGPLLAAMRCGVWHGAIRNIQSVLTFRVVVMVGACFLRLLLAGCQHIVKRVVTDALPATSTDNILWCVNVKTCPQIVGSKALIAVS